MKIYQEEQTQKPQVVPEKPKKPNRMTTKRTSSRCHCLGSAATLIALLLLLACSLLPATAGKIPAGFTEHFAEVNGCRVHYFIGGKGSPVVLLHGYAETSHMWLPIMPLLAQQHTVIVPDLRGAGGSSKPESGYDKKNMAGGTNTPPPALEYYHRNISCQY